MKHTIFYISMVAFVFSASNCNENQKSYLKKNKLDNNNFLTQVKKYHAGEKNETNNEEKIDKYKKTIDSLKEFSKEQKAKSDEKGIVDKLIELYEIKIETDKNKYIKGFQKKLKLSKLANMIKKYIVKTSGKPVQNINFFNELFKNLEYFKHKLKKDPINSSDLKFPELEQKLITYMRYIYFYEIYKYKYYYKEVIDIINKYREKFKLNLHLLSKKDKEPRGIVWYEAILFYNIINKFKYWEKIDLIDYVLIEAMSFAAYKLFKDRNGTKIKASKEFQSILEESKNKLDEKQDENKFYDGDKPAEIFERLDKFEREDKPYKNY